MTRGDYMNQLAHCLASLPLPERNAALEYYNEFFEEAGPDREQQVIEELGSPSQVAAAILSGNGGWRTGSATFSPAPYSTVPPRQQAGGFHFQWWMAVVAILAFPLWFPLLAVAFGLSIGAIVAVGALLFALVVTVLALLFGGLVGLCGWLVAATGGHLPAFLTVPTGLWGLGICLSFLGGGLLLLALSVWLFGMALPRLWKWGRAQWDTHRRTNKKEEEV